VFSTMALARGPDALDSKVRGTLNLYERFSSREAELGLFMMLSAIAGIKDNPSESNDAAGNKLPRRLRSSLRRQRSLFSRPSILA